MGAEPGYMDAALECAKRGWAVFPLVPGEKTPAVAGGFKVATTDLDQIEQAWRANPRFNVGIATGGMSNGLLVIDLDVDDSKDEDGYLTLRSWELEHGELPETVTAVTGRGGLHMLYRVDEPIACSVNSELGVDIRCEGGYFVAPPSLHPNGSRYEWENDPSDYRLAKADANVLAFVRHVQPERLTRGAKFELPAQIAAGDRNDTMMRFAASMQARGEDDVFILAALEAANKLRCKPPMGERELQKIVESVTSRYDKGSPKKPEGARYAALMLKPNGQPLQTIENCSRVLSSDPALAGRFYYDVRGFTRMVTLPLPWDSGKGDRPVSDADYCGLAAYLEVEHGLMSKQKAIDAVVNVSMQNKRNPVAEWLDSLEWDGEGRVSTLMCCYLGCEPNDYNIACTWLFMLGAVARGYEPGTKFDYMPVLIGPQGLGKSTFIQKLCPRQSWYCDNFNTIAGDDASEKLRGLWIAEMAELLATKKQKDVEAVKAFITSTVDTIRPKYARETEQRPRACVFCGTTNDTSFLTDATGNRRFLPIECGVEEPCLDLFDESADGFIAQAWAEAVHRWKSERPKLVLDKRLQKYAMEKQEQYTEDDPRIGMVQEFLDGKLAVAEQNGAADRVRVCVQEIMEEALPEAYAKQASSRFLINEMHKIMQNKINGWVPYPKSNGKARCGSYGVQRCYVPSCVAEG